VASCGLAMAQASGAGADKTEGSDAGPGRPALLQSSQATSAPTSNRMQQKKSSLNVRQSTGTAFARPGHARRHTR